MLGQLKKKEHKMAEPPARWQHYQVQGDVDGGVLGDGDVVTLLLRIDLPLPLSCNTVGRKVEATYSFRW